MSSKLQCIYLVARKQWHTQYYPGNRYVWDALTERVQLHGLPVHDSLRALDNGWQRSHNKAGGKRLIRGTWRQRDAFLQCCLALLHFSVISLLFMLHSFIIFTQDGVNSVFLLIHQCYFREDNSQFLVSMPHSFTVWGNCLKSFSVNKLKGMSRETNAQVPFPSKGSLALSLPSLQSYHTSTLSVVWLTNQSLR